MTWLRSCLCNSHRSAFVAILKNSVFISNLWSSCEPYYTSNSLSWHVSRQCQSSWWSHILFSPMRSSGALARGRQHIKDNAIFQSSSYLPHVEPAAYSPSLGLGDRVRTARYQETYVDLKEQFDDNSQVRQHLNWTNSQILPSSYTACLNESLRIWESLPFTQYDFHPSLLLNLIFKCVADYFYLRATMISKSNSRVTKSFRVPKVIRHFSLWHDSPYEWSEWLDTKP